MTPRKKQEKPAPARPAPAPREDEVNEEIREDFEERQDLSEAGRRQLAERLSQHNSQSPAISAGDVDAAWEDKQSGEEHFTGHAPTPDQDVVDLMGEAAGLTYSDTEPLDYGRVAERDKERWELDPRSALEEDDEDALDEDEDDEAGLTGDAEEDDDDLLAADDDDDEDEDDDELLFWDDGDDLDEEVEGD